MSKSLKYEDPHDSTYAQLGHLLYAMPLNVKPVLQQLDEFNNSSNMSRVSLPRINIGADFIT